MVLKETLAYDDSQTVGEKNVLVTTKVSDHIDDLEYRIISSWFMIFQFDESV